MFNHNEIELIKENRSHERFKRELQRDQIVRIFNRWKTGEQMADWENAMLMQSGMFNKEIKKLSGQLQMEAKNDS